MPFGRTTYDDDVELNDFDFDSAGIAPRKCLFCGGIGWTWEGGPCGCDSEDCEEEE
jgi:hypothetical protein